MTRRVGSDASPRRAVTLGLIFGWLCLVPPMSVRAQAPNAGLQMTVFGVLATPGQGTDDPKLKDVLPQLRMLFPQHSFKLLKVESKRVVKGQSVMCDLGGGFIAGSQLAEPIDPNGKVQMRFQLTYNGLNQYQTIVTTPPGQIFYVNRTLPNGERLVIGIGAR